LLYAIFLGRWEDGKMRRWEDEEMGRWGDGILTLQGS